jgi:hypothetical protein
MQLKSNALPDLIWRLKPAIDPATRFFLVALFIVGFTSSYFGDLRSKTHPQYAANADVFSRTRAGTMYVRNLGNAPGSKLGNVASASLNGLSPEGLLRRRPSTRLRRLWAGMEQGQTSAP